MRKPKPHPKNPLGVTTETLLLNHFRRARVEREAREAAERANRERVADARHIRKLDRRSASKGFLEKRLKRLLRYPSVSMVRQLAEILGDPATPEDCRVIAASAILRFADFGDDHSPGRPPLEDPGNGILARPHRP